MHRAQSYFEVVKYEEAIRDLDIYLLKYKHSEIYFLRGKYKIDAGLDGCVDLKLALDLGFDSAIGLYANNCIN